MPGEARSTKEQILLAAERMIADHGVDGVSMRQIADRRYVAATTRRCSTTSDPRRSWSRRSSSTGSRDYANASAELIAERVPSDLRGWLECQIVAVLEQSDLPDSNYLSFVASISQHGGEAFRHLPKRFAAGQREYEEHVRSCLADLEEPLRTHRFAQFMEVTVHTGATGSTPARRRAVLPLALEVMNLVDCMVGFLAAAVSPTSEAALASADGAVFRQTLFV